jgi:hypothetical protein
MADGRARYTSVMFDSSRWDGFELRPDDIVISTPAKCGTTWTQMICALLIFQTPDLPEHLGVLSPWIDMMTRPRDEIVADLDAQTHRRFIKTHTPRDGLPIEPGVTYICVGRDPRDVCLSWDNHMDNTDIEKMITRRAEAVGLDDVMDKLLEGPPERPDGEIDRFWLWMDEDVDPTENSHNLRGTLHHVTTFWNVRDDPDVVLVHYDDLADDTQGEMRRLATRLGIDVPEARWPELVAAASFERMSAGADALTPESNTDVWHDNARFFNKGTSGQWRRLLDADGEARYWKRVNTLAAPDVVQWMHRS